MGNRWGNSGNCDRLYFGGSKITADGDCSHEIKRRLLLGRKLMTNLDSILKSRDIVLPTKVCLFKAIVFPVVMYGYESRTKIARRNINNCRYADDTTLIAESEEELNSLLMMKEESEKTGLKFNIQKTNIMTSGHITVRQIDGEKVEAVTDFIFLGSKITADSDYSHKIKRRE